LIGALQIEAGKNGIKPENDKIVMEMRQPDYSILTCSQNQSIRPAQDFIFHATAKIIEANPARELSDG
jgi:hypothetical protein